MSEPACPAPEDIDHREACPTGRCWTDFDGNPVYCRLCAEWYRRMDLYFGRLRKDPGDAT